MNTVVYTLEDLVPDLDKRRPEEDGVGVVEPREREPAGESETASENLEGDGEESCSRL